MDTITERVARIESRADAERLSGLLKFGVNLEAILDAREGLTGEAQANHAISKCDALARAYLSGDARESAKIARLHYEIGCLRGELRRVCGAFAEVVEPLQ